MGRDTFDAVLASVPNGATAARVTSESRDNWTPKRQFSPGLLHWDSPPQMFAWTPTLKNNIPNLTGLKYGRLTVLGLMYIRPQEQGIRWVVRCACGDYEVRKTKTIRERNEGSDRCHNCHESRQISVRYAQFGSRPIEDFTRPNLPLAHNKTASEQGGSSV